MGWVIRFAEPHAGAPSVAREGGGERGYKSGRNSCRDTPEMRSTASTRSGGTSSHWEIAWIDMPRGSANPANPPTASIARLRASLGSVMIRDSSIALHGSQAALHCGAKGELYSWGMTLGSRIRKAREDRGMTQEELADFFPVRPQAVSSWERDIEIPHSTKWPTLRRALKVTYMWLLEGGDLPPPPANAPEVRIENLPPNEQPAVHAGIDAMLEALKKQRTDS